MLDESKILNNSIVFSWCALRSNRLLLKLQLRVPSPKIQLTHLEVQQRNKKVKGSKVKDFSSCEARKLGKPIGDSSMSVKPGVERL